jgi:hypothetical protein
MRSQGAAVSRAGAATMMERLRQRLQEWRRRPPPPVPPVPAPPAPPEPEISLETVKLIAEVAVREYANENDIQKGLDAKAATWIGATGAILILAIGTLGKIPVTGRLFGDRFAFEVGYTLAVGMAILLLVLAEVWFVRAFTVRIYLRLDPGEWADFAEARHPPVDAYIRLAGDYSDIVRQNRTIGEAKASLQQAGVRWFLAALLALLIVLGLNLWATW